MNGEHTPSGTTHGAAHSGRKLEGALEEGVTPEATVLSVGQLLGTTREACGLTIIDVSKALKLSQRQVESLESDDWENLPCNTIIRGFVRNYARLLELDPVPLMAALDRLQMPLTPELKMTTGTPVNMQRDSRVDGRDYLRMFAGLVVLVLAILAYFFFPQEVWQSTLSALKAAAQPREVIEEKAVVPAEHEIKTPEPAMAPPATATAFPEASVAAPTQSMSAPVLPSSLNSALKFSFSKPAWVEVRDRTGQIIFSQLSQAGSQRDIEGQPPFVLVVGNAAHVTLQYKGKAIDLSKRSKDDVARLTLD